MFQASTINYRVGGMPGITTAAKQKLWVRRKHLCKAATRLTEENARQIKSRMLAECKGDEINVNSLTEVQRIKYGIPDNERLLALVAEFTAEEERQKQHGYTKDTMIADVDEAFHSMSSAKLNFHTYYNSINEKYNVTKENCRLFAQRWAVWQYVLENYSRYKLAVWYNAYAMHFPQHLSDTNSFLNFKKACDQKGIEAKVIDQRAIVKVGKRISTFQEAFLKSLYIQPQKISPADAAKKLEAACTGIAEKPYSLGSIKNYFREFERDIELYSLRYGAGAAQKQLPHATLLPAEHRNTQWQIDGWTMPFWGQQFQRYVLYLIRDNHSRKIVGYSIAPSENTALILEAMEDATRNTGVFPAELVSDKHSFHKTAIAERLRQETERMGAIWTVTMNAQRNQLAERYNQYLDALCKDFAGYTGKNMTAKSKDARPSPEAQDVTAKAGNWKMADEIRAIAAYVVIEFNRTKLELLEGLSPNEKYNASEDKKCFALSEADRLQLLRPVSEYIVQRGQITIKIGSTKHEFQLPAELIRRYNNTAVTVVYEDLTQGIYISDIKTGEELGCIPPKRKIRGAIADQTETDKRYLNQLTGRKNGITTKARKAAQQTIIDALRENPDAIEIINAAALPKDIRALAAQDSELKRQMAVQGINTNLIPIRAGRAAELPQPAGKTKSSPFAVKSNQPLKRLSIQDITGIDSEA